METAVKQSLWDSQIKELTEHLSLLPDKPEETAESTLKALWYKAAGVPKSAEAADVLELPELDAAAETILPGLVQKRISGIPLAHISGRQQFMGVELLAGPEALVPRKETELLGNAALKLLNEMETANRSLTLIDVCTGAGNLAVALSVIKPGIRTFAADLSEEAVSLAKENVNLHQLEGRVEMRAGDLLEPFNSTEFYENVDLLLCNPPYISSAKVDTMAGEISEYEPRLAFDGGPFGIKILNRLMKEAPTYLKINGWLAFEVGLGQGPAVAKRLEMHKQFENIRLIKDIRGDVRALCAQRVI